MNELMDKYLRSVAEKFTRETTTEMGYRTDFEILLKGIFKGINVQEIAHSISLYQPSKKSDSANRPSSAARANLTSAVPHRG